MLLMSLAVLAALVAVVLLSLFFAAKAGARRAEAAREVDARVALIQKKAHEADERLAAAVLAGAGVDAAVAQFQKERAALLPAARTDDPWAWAADDLDAHRAADLRRRREEVGRRLLVPAVGSVLVVVLVTAGVLAALYHHAGPSPAALPDPPNAPAWPDPGAVAPPTPTDATP